MKNTARYFLIAFFSCLSLLVSVSPVFAASGGDGIEVLDHIPVQHAGRVKPFQSFANEAVLYITGKTRFNNEAPSRLVWEWMAQADAWFNKPLIPVTREKLRGEFKLMLVGGRLSPEVALNHEPFMQEVRAAAARQQRKDRLSEDEKQLLDIYQKASLFQSIVQGEIPGLIPHPSEPTAGWLPIQSVISDQGRSIIKQFFPADRVDALGESLAVLLDEFRKEDASPSPEAARRFTGALSALLESRNVILDRKAIDTEVRYNNLHPFSRAAFLYFGSMLLSILSLLLLTGSGRGLKSGAGLLSGGSLLMFAGAFLLHGYGFYLRCSVAGRPPVTNMYESMIWVSWAVALFSVILFASYRNWILLNTASFVTGICLTIANRFPLALNPAISPLMPVLRSNLWLTVHVLTITMSYGAFALAWGLGHGVLFSYAAWPEKRERLRALSQYLYRTLQIGVVLLAAGTILGGVWANYSWGRFWGWDPKETWALIALLGYILVLHGRFAGWLADFGIAVGSIIAFLGVLMAWYGVNFVLAAGLHSYGFGGGGIRYVLLAIAADFIILGALVFRYKSRRETAAAAGRSARPEREIED